MNVETILQQIRERVIAEEDTSVSSITQPNGAPPNGSAAHSSMNESLTRASAHLTVTRRAWDRLPPVISNRSGSLARFELWIKRTCKSLTRWFTWEQVNFNRGVNDALGDVIEILKIEAEELASLRAQLNSHEQLASQMRRELLELTARANETEAALARVSDAMGNLADEARGGHSQLANKLDELAAALRAEQQAGKSAQDQELNRRLAELAAELREDQRVCFRQLSLETSESAVLEDRARRELLTRLEKLEASASRKPQ